MINAPTPKTNRRAVWALTLLLCAMTGAWGYFHDCSREPDDTGDESVYLDQAAWVAEHGGIIGYVKLCFKGEYPQGQAYPLLSVLASPFAKRDLSFIRPARLFKAALTALSLILIFLLTARLAGETQGALVVAMLALSRNWLGKAGVFTIDPIIYALVFLAWLLIAGIWRPRGRWFWAGAAFGIAHMAKGTALLLAAGLFLAVAWRFIFGAERIKLLRSQRLWKAGLLFIVGWLIAAMPLIVQTAHESTPASFLTKFMPQGLWLDKWSQHLDVNPERAAQGMQGYFAAHGFSGAAKRLAWGMGMQVPRFLGVFAVDKEGPPKFLWLLSVVISAALVLFAARGVLREQRKWARLYTICFIAAGFVLYSWFSAITYASRFAATFGPVFAWYAAAGIVALTEKWRTRSAGNGSAANLVLRRGTVSLLSILVLCLIISNGKRLPATPFEPLPLKPDYARLMSWYDEDVVKTGATCIHTMKLGWRFRFLWLLEPSKSLDMPETPDFRTFQEYADKVGARYFLVVREAVEIRKPVLGSYLRDDLAKGLEEIAAIPGWKEVMRDEDGVCDYVIYERRVQNAEHRVQSAE